VILKLEVEVKDLPNAVLRVVMPSVLLFVVNEGGVTSKREGSWKLPRGRRLFLYHDSLDKKVV
jgi:hypothetical protein